jgi:hypothetical protein
MRALATLAAFALAARAAAQSPSPSPAWVYYSPCVRVSLRAQRRARPLRPQLQP